MRNIKFLDEPGFIYDLFFLFSFNFNKDYCLTNFINYSKSSEDTDYYCKILNEFSPISNDLLLFFYFILVVILCIYTFFTIILKI